MTTRTVRLCAAFVLATAAAWASAQTPPIKPGLWEVKSEGHVDGNKTPPAADRLQGLSPALRAQVEASMKEKGVAMGPGGVTRICFSRESMDPARWGEVASCKTEYGARSNSSWKWYSVCTEPEMTIDGEAIFANPENYRVLTTTTMKRRDEVKTSQRALQAQLGVLLHRDREPHVELVVAQVVVRHAGVRVDDLGRPPRVLGVDPGGDEHRLVAQGARVVDRRDLADDAPVEQLLDAGEHGLLGHAELAGDRRVRARLDRERALHRVQQPPVEVVQRYRRAALPAADLGGGGQV